MNTVHSFQGSEADAVILDLVVDNPHRQANIFVPAADEEMRRLLNVAMTRARRRLIVVGNSDWLRKKGGSSFVGKSLLRFLEERYPLRAAHELALLEPTADLLHQPDVVLSGQMHRMLLSDMDQAHSRVIVFSSALTLEVIERMEERLRLASTRISSSYLRYGRCDLVDIITLSIFFNVL
jgi:hypothetical protein